MIDRIKLLIYIALILFLTTINNMIIYLIVLAVMVLLKPLFFIKSAKKVALSIIIFNGVISVSYAIYSAIFFQLDSNYLILINLRVFTIAYSTFFFVRNVNLFKALSFSKTLSFLLALTYSQVINYINIFYNLKDAYKSRIIREKENKYPELLSVAAINLFFTKSIVNAKEISLALRSRGLFDVESK